MMFSKLQREKNRRKSDLVVSEDIQDDDTRKIFYQGKGLKVADTNHDWNPPNSSKINPRKDFYRQRHDNSSKENKTTYNSSMCQDEIVEVVLQLNSLNENSQHGDSYNNNSYSIENTCKDHIQMNAQIAMDNNNDQDGDYNKDYDTDKDHDNDEYYKNYDKANNKDYDNDEYYKNYDKANNKDYDSVDALFDDDTSNVDDAAAALNGLNFNEWTLKEKWISENSQNMETRVWTNGFSFEGIYKKKQAISGIWKYPDDQILYEGEIKDESDGDEQLVPNGNGYLRVRDCDVEYRGTFLNGEAHGFGESVWKNEIRFKGDWYFGRVHGNGIFHCQEYTLSGCFGQEGISGPGLQEWKDGKTYEGEFEDGCFHGNGTLLWNSRQMYVGRFKHNVISGEGRLRWQTDDQENNEFNEYEGNFLKNTFHGTGKLNFANGYCYIGHHHYGEFHGKGTLSNSNQDSGNLFLCKGDWYESQLEGFATLSFLHPYGLEEEFATSLFLHPYDLEKNTSSTTETELDFLDRIEQFLKDDDDANANANDDYSRFTQKPSHVKGMGFRFHGMMKNSKPMGMAEMFYSNGDYSLGNHLVKEGNLNLEGKGLYYWGHSSILYRGTFVSGVPHGKGQLFLPTGDQYKGKFQDGLPHGRGRLISGTGDFHTIEGKWKCGRPSEIVSSFNESTDPSNQYYHHLTDSSTEKMAQFKLLRRYDQQCIPELCIFRKDKDLLDKICNEIQRLPRYSKPLIKMIDSSIQGIGNSADAHEAQNIIKTTYISFHEEEVFFPESKKSPS